MNHTFRELSQTELAMVAGGGELAYFPIAGGGRIDLAGIVIAGGINLIPIGGGTRLPGDLGIGGVFPGLDVNLIPIAGGLPIKQPEPGKP